MARPPRAVRTDHPAPSDDTHGGLAIGTEDAPDAPRRALAGSAQTRPTTAPGERFRYSNDGWKIVGACLEEVTGTRDRAICSPSASSARSACDTPSARITEQRVPDDRRRLRADPVGPTARSCATRCRPPRASCRTPPTARSRPTRRHGRVRAAAPRARRRARRSGRPHHDRRDVLDADRGWRRRRRGRPYAYGLSQEVVDGAPWIAHSGGMVGYTALLAISPDEGLGLVILQNGGGGKRSVAAYALAAVRAGLAGDRAPPTLGAARPDRDRGRRGYVGPLPRRRRPRARRRHRRRRPGRHVGPVAVRLERDPLEPEPGDVFLVVARRARSLPAGVRARRRRDRRRGVPRDDLVPARGYAGSQSLTTSPRRSGARPASTATTTRGLPCCASSRARAHSCCSGPTRWRGRSMPGP